MAAQSAPAYRIWYLAARARAEPIHLLLAHAGVPCERRDFTMQELGARAHKKRFGEFSQLPVLELLRGEHVALIAQTGSIMRYLARAHGLVATDALEAAKQDEAFELSQEFAKVNPLLNLTPREELPEKIAALIANGAGSGSGYPLLPRVRAAELLLGARPFFGGVEPCYADFNMFHYLDVLDTLVPGALRETPALGEWMARLATLPGPSAYLCARAPLGSETLGKPGALCRDKPTPGTPRAWERAS